MTHSIEYASTLLLKSNTKFWSRCPIFSIIIISNGKIRNFLGYECKGLGVYNLKFTGQRNLTAITGVAEIVIVRVEKS